MANRIEDYALLGDGRTVALVSRDGSIDWLCLPRVDSDACCAALLGTADNGYWKIFPVGTYRVTRAYARDTMVLETTFATDTGIIRLTDFLVIGGAYPTLVRQISGLSGAVRCRCELSLRFDYGLVRPVITQRNKIIEATVGPDRVILRSPLSLSLSRHGVLGGEFDVVADQYLSFTLSYSQSHGLPPEPIDIVQATQVTKDFWRGWASQFRRETPWRDAVVRSLLTLKALIYHQTGAMIAAPTTSLPETPGGTLNWDYRFCWLRDATFTISALINAGYHDEAVEWREWMLRAIASEPEKMRVLYRVDGGRRTHEEVVPWLAGYENAVPIRIGNNAAAQRQIDVVGELLTCLDLMDRAGIASSDRTIETRNALVLHLERTWSDKGQGLWESRGKPQHYTYPRVMAWSGIKSYLRSAGRQGLMNEPIIVRMHNLATYIHHEVMERSWSVARGHFVDRYDGSQLDASLLLMPLVGFLPANDPRMSATIDAIERELSEDGLVWRQPRHGDLEQGAFIACSCWLADCRMLQGRRDDALKLLECVLSLRNDVGLLSEIYHPGLRRLMGNFPQALSHLALINTVLGLSGPVLQRAAG
jgi:GH15 family glucan-1,4-alpha-glucosidase